MRIGIDAACWSNRRGYGRFTRELFNALLKIDHNNEYVFFLDPETNALNNFPDRVSRNVIGISEAPARAASSSGRRSFKDILKVSKVVASERLDILFFPSVYTYCPVISNAKKIVAIHDVIAEKYPDLVFTKRKYRMYWNLKVWLAIKQSNLIVTVSDFSKNGIAEHFKIPDNRIRVVSEAADPIFKPVRDKDLLSEILGQYGLDLSAKFILYVGGIAPHKNLSTLISAYLKLIAGDRHKDVKLVLVGDYEKDVFLVDHEIMKQLNEPHFKNNVILPGFVPDDKLVYLYSAASVLVLPSFIEGFGLPAVEAMACGTPVIGSETTSLPEVMGEAGLFFDPGNPDDLREKLIGLLDDDEFREDLGRRSVQRAATFSWQQSAVQLLNVFNEMGNNGQAS